MTKTHSVNESQELKAAWENDYVLRNFDRFCGWNQLPRNLGLEYILTMSWIYTPRVLANEQMMLEPLGLRHLDELCAAMIPDPDGWYTKMFGLNTRSAYAAELADSEKFLKEQSGVGFAIREISSGKIAGITFFLKMDHENRHLEIGSTNIAPTFRRSYVNTAAKFLMLREAFDVLACVRVSFRIDSENSISKKAVERIGAKFGGVLRNERTLPDGRVRDYGFYCITSTEWANVKVHLEQLLARETV